MSKHFPERMLIGGELVESETRQWDISINPADEEPLGRVPRGSAVDMNRAVAAAEAAWPKWFRSGPDARTNALYRFAAAIEARAQELLETEVVDTGNTITAMGNDVSNTVASLRYFGGLTREMKGYTVPGSSNMMHLTEHEPYGVVGRIAPFNHPLLFSVGRTAAALAAGNAVVVKPPETSPLSALILAEIAKECLPAGVFNIVTGTGAQAGNALVRHPRVKRIAFIGSPDTGRAIQRSAAEVGVKHVSLELGGKNPMIALPDCDVEEVARAALQGMNFNWQGQSCGSTSRLFLHEDIHDAVLERLLEKVSRLRIGNPLSRESQMGPVNSKMIYDRVHRYIGYGQEDGAKLSYGGRRPEGAEFNSGYWIEPTVFSGVTQGMRLAREEIFGPVLSVMRWRDSAKLVEEANATEYGLTASIWTRDVNAAIALTRQIRSGYIWINTTSAHYRGVPFGGFGASGTGREESIEELFSYTETKAINIAFKPGFA
jgi:acyl-CoA reductase-like NAD-dependent aldehyde dehydrogenase